MKKKKLPITTILFCVLALFAGCGKSEAIYTSGVYTATAEGYAGSVSVEVKFDKHSILEIRIVAHNETLDIVDVDRAIDEMPGKIVDAQSWDVDAITSATITSDAIRDAVKDCVEQATIK